MLIPISPNTELPAVRSTDARSATETSDHPGQGSRHPYVMGSPREGRGLERKNDSGVIEHHLRWAGVDAGMRCLDVGCGTGTVTRLMGKMAGAGAVVGVDFSGALLTRARELAVRQGLDIEFIEGEAVQLRFPAAYFDLSWSRFLFEYLPDPVRALAEMIRVTRPGGTVVAADCDAQTQQMYPFDPALQSDVADALRLFGDTGFDPFVGRKLYHWFYQAGLQDIEVKVTPHHVYAGEMPDRDMRNWQGKLATVAERLSKRTGDRQRCERWRLTYLSELQRPDSLYYSTLFVVKGKVPSIPE